MLEFTDTVSRVLIPSDGNLSAPKGMLVKDSCLLIADVGKLAVYDLRDTAAVPQIVRFPDGELYVNDMALHGNTLYVTVTNTGSIYSLDVTRPYAIDTASLKPYVTIPGANGIAIRGDTMYVASYPPDGVTTPTMRSIVSKTFRRLWRQAVRPAGAVRRLGTERRRRPPLFYELGRFRGGVLRFRGQTGSPARSRRSDRWPGRLSLDGDRLYVPDLPGSRVVILPL